MARLLPIGLLLLLCCGCQRGFADPSREFAEPLPQDRTWPSVVHEPTAFGVLATPLVVGSDERDVPAGTRCEACHDQPPDPTWQPAPGELFHDNIEVQHGELTCSQCHDPETRALHLADDELVPWVEVIRLCGQCHGTQRRDFEHGAHGGMNGHWDLHQGTRERNNCVDCHAPHAPAFGKRKPVFPPRDRYLRGLNGDEPHAAPHDAAHDAAHDTPEHPEPEAHHE